MEDEAVQRRRWMEHGQFLDLVGVTHLLPGPNAVEMASHIGYRRAGLVGSVVAGTCFTLPAVLLALALAWTYQHFGRIPQVEPVLAGIKPAVLAVILAAVVRLGRKALGVWATALAGFGVMAAVMAGCDELLAFLLGSLVGVLLLAVTRRSAKAGGAGLGLLAPMAAAGSGSSASVGAAAAASAPVSLATLGLFFLKVAFVMYGGGYVLVAYLEGDIVGDYGWMTRGQLLDAVAIGQITPGPMLSTATFVGYVLAGVPGAVVATLGMLLPCFLVVAVANPLVPRLRRWPWTSRLLDAVNAASVGLMMAVTVKLSSSALQEPAGPLGLDLPACAIAVVAALLAIRWKVAPAWLVLLGAVAGMLFGLVAGR